MSDEAELCDACGARAYVQVYVGSFTTSSLLLFCGHHYAQHEAKFVDTALMIVDHRDLILGGD